MNMLITEVPVLAPEKHSFPKADFSSNSTVVFPFLPMKALGPLFTGMAPMNCSHTAHTPVCVLFQPMRCQRCPAQRQGRSTCLRPLLCEALRGEQGPPALQRVSGALLEHRQAVLSETNVACATHPHQPHQKKEATSPSSPSPHLCVTASQEREESIKYLSGPACAPLPKVLNPVLTVDGPLSETMRIRRKSPFESTGHPQLL